jgi:hypothetical protein
MAFDPRPPEPDELIKTETSAPLIKKIMGGAPIMGASFNLLETLKKTPSTEKYMNLFLPVWSSDTKEINIPDDKLFLISRERIDLEDDAWMSQDSYMYDYTSIEEEELSISLTAAETYTDESGFERSEIDTSAGAKKYWSISYGEKEALRLISLYGDAVPQLQVTLDEDPLGATATTSNSVQNEGISFDSLSSLGAISQEGFTLSLTTSTEGTAIEQREAVVTDVGGVTTAAARRNVGASERIEVGGESGNVFITSGY